jgi:hypothetical protein
MSEPTPMPAAQPETATAPPYVRQPAARWPEPGGEDVAEAAESAGPPARTATEPEGERRPEAEPEPEPDAVEPEPVEPEPVEAGPVPLGIARTPTGNPDVDAALDRLADADELPTGSHLEVYEDAHGRMREALEELDRAQGPPPPPVQAPAGPAPYAQQHRPGPPPPAPHGPPPPRPGAHPYRPGNP